MLPLWETAGIPESASEGFAIEEQILFLQKVEVIVEHLFNQVCFTVLYSHFSPTYNILSDLFY